MIFVTNHKMQSHKCWRKIFLLAVTFYHTLMKIFVYSLFFFPILPCSCSVPQDFFKYFPRYQKGKIISMSVESFHVPVPYSCCITCICIPSLMVSGSFYHLSGHQDLGISIWLALQGKKRYCQTPLQSKSVKLGVDFVLVSHPRFQGWSPSIPRMVNHYPHDGHIPSPGWSPTNNRMVSHHHQVNQSGAWFYALAQCSLFWLKILWL